MPEPVIKVANLTLFIGVAALIVMVAVGNGANEAVRKQLESLGTNLVVIQPGAVRTGGVRSGAGSASTLTVDDARAISREDSAVAKVGYLDSRDRSSTEARTGRRTFKASAPTIHQSPIGASPRVGPSRRKTAARLIGRPTNAPSAQIVILDRDRTLVRQHYYGQYAAGNCPPGLAKKDNGGLPPGQAKQWIMGQPLPQYVVYKQRPQVLVTQLTPLPMGYQYIRVDNDVLLFSLATRMIENVVFDLSNLRD